MIENLNILTTKNLAPQNLILNEIFKWKFYPYLCFKQELQALLIYPQNL